MGSVQSPSGRMGQFLAAFDERLELWEDETSASQAGLFPGTPVPDRTTRLVPIPAGEGSADTVYLRELTGGFPGAGASWAYRLSTLDPWIGWDPPTTVTYTETVEWDAALGSEDHHAPSLCVDDNDVVIMCSEYRAAGASTRAAYVGKRATDGTWTISASSMWSETVAASERKLWPVVVKMPDGRIRLYHLHYDDPRDIAQVWVWELEDGGDASAVGDWVLISRACLSSPIDISGGAYPAGLRVAVGRGQVMLCWAYGVGVTFTIEQWYSRNDGITFDYVSSVETEEVEQRFDLAFAHGAFLLAHVVDDPDTVDELLVVRRVANAATALSGSSSVTVRTTLTAAVSAVDCTLVPDPSGLTWLYLNNAGTEDFQAWISEDAGATWHGADADRGRRMYGDKAVLNSAMVWWRDRILHVHRTGDATGYDGCLICDHLGGDTTLTMPLGGWGARYTDRASWTRTWTPWTDPGNVSTVNVTSTPTSAFDASGRWVVTTTAGEDYTIANSADDGGAEMARVAFSLINGLAVFSVRSSDGTDETAIRVEITYPSTDYTLEIYDDVSNTLLDTVTVTDAGDVELLVRVDGGSWSLHHAAWAAGVRTYTEGATGTGLTTSAGTAASSSFRVGDSGGGGGAQCEIMLFASLRCQGTTVEKSGGYGLDDLLGRLSSSKPQHIVEGVALYATGGPGRPGDTWTIAPDAEHARAQAAWTSTYPSPRQHWRSLDTSQAAIAWRISGGDPSRKLQPMWAIALAYPAQTIGVSWFDGSNWTTETEVQLFEAITCTRTGTTLVPSSGAANTGGTWYDEDALAGGYAVSGLSGTGSCRRIVRNTAGILQASSGTTWRKAELTLEGVDGTEPSGGVTWRIVPPRVLLLIRAPDTMEGVRLRWSTNSLYRQNPDDYITGKVLVGPAYVLGYSHGRDAAWTVEVPREETEMRDGGRWSTSPAPKRRIVELSWAQSMELTRQLRGSSVAPDYLQAWESTGDPAGSVGEQHATIAALVGRWSGDGTPVLYGTYDRADAPSGATDITVVRRGWLVGTVEPSWTWEHAGHGEEELDEALRLGQLTLRELV